jgi:acetyl-CoA acetyltransferase
MSLSGKYVIAGIGHTAFGSLPGRSTYSLNIEAIRNALADAGIEKNLVDALMVKPPTSAGEMMYAHKLAEAIGLQPNIVVGMDAGGAANFAALSYAVMAIDAGQCEIAVICYADTPKSGTRAVYEKERSGDGIFGWHGVAPGYAMIARRHMEQYGTTHDQLGAIVVTTRKHGAANPNAQLRKALTLDDYRALPMLVDPFKRDDCALISDGGAAVIVMSAARAKELKVKAPIPILGFGQGHSSWEMQQRADLTATAATKSAAVAFAMAGLKPKDMDVAQIYDCFTITPLITLEDYGFCKRGDGGRFAANEGVGIDGALPMNTSGGLLSETGMPGLQLLIEGVRQMRGTANLQVKNAKKGVVSNQGGIMQSHATLILSQ